MKRSSSINKSSSMKRSSNSIHEAPPMKRSSTRRPLNSSSDEYFPRLGPPPAPRVRCLARMGLSAWGGRRVGRGALSAWGGRLSQYYMLTASFHYTRGQGRGCRRPTGTWAISTGAATCRCALATGAAGGGVQSLACCNRRQLPAGVQYEAINRCNNAAITPGGAMSAKRRCDGGVWWRVVATMLHVLMLHVHETAMPRHARQARTWVADSAWRCTMPDAWAALASPGSSVAALRSGRRGRDARQART